MSRDPYAVGDIDNHQASKDEEVTQAIEKRPWIKSEGVCPDLLLENPKIQIEVQWSNMAIVCYGAFAISNHNFWKKGYYSAHITHWRPLDK